MKRLSAEMRISEELRELESRKRSLGKLIANSTSGSKMEALKVELWNVRRRQEQLIILGRQVV